MAKWGLQNLSDEALDDLERAGGDISKLGDSTLEEMEMWESAMAPKPKAPEVPAWQSAAMGAGNAMALGFGDEIAGVAGAITGKGYEKTRDSVRRAQDVAKADNPNAYTAGSVVGAIPSAVALPGAGSVAGAAALGGGQAGAMSLGESDELSPEAFTEALKSAGMGAALAGTAQAVMPSLFEQARKYGKKGAEWLAKNLGTNAEKMAERATGATRVEAQRFKPGTGRELLDTGIVSAGDTPQRIANKAAMVKEVAGEQVGDTLQAAAREGAETDLGRVFDDLYERSQELAKNPALKAQKAAIDRRLQDILDMDANTVPVTRGEAIKRGYDKSVNYDTQRLKPNTSAGIKDVADAFRKENERAMSSASPALSEAFEQGKETFGRMTPVAKAAQNRADQINQNPALGFNDLTAIASGTMTGGVAGGIIAPLARRQLGARFSATSAVSMDKLGKIAQATPDVLGKFAKPIQDAANRGPQAVGVVHQILMRDYPEYAALFGGSEDDADGQ